MRRSYPTETGRIGVLIATLYPNTTGGVLSMARTVCAALGRTGRYDPLLLYNPVAYDDGRNIGVLRMLRGRVRPGLEKESHFGVGGVCIGRRFPSLEVFHYLGNLPEWLSVSRRHEILQVVSGYNHCGLAFAVSGRPFVCWVATAMDEDKIGKESEWPVWFRPLESAQRPLLRIIEGYIFRRCAHVATLSRYTADLIIHRYRVSPERVSVLPCPIDTDHFHPGSSAERSRVVLFVGRVGDPRKNVVCLLRAFARLRREVPQARLVLVGEEPAGHSIRAQAGQLGLDGHIQFVGAVPREETAHWYRQASVLAISSLQEGLGIVGLEAMACGVPVVSTRCGGPEEYVRDGANGYLVPKGDDAMLADRLKVLLMDEATRSALGRQARAGVEEKFSYGRLLPRFEQIYRKVWPELFDEGSKVGRG